jgi:hypothetical protein
MTMNFDISNRRGGSRRVRLARVLLVALSVVAATSVSAYARDMCMQGDYGPRWVLKRFKLPRPGKCAPLQGFEDSPNNSGAMSGMGCTNAGGNSLTLNYSAHNIGYPTYFEAGTCRFELPIPPEGRRDGCWFTYVAGGETTYGSAQWTTLSYCDDVDLRY